MKRWAVFAVSLLALDATGCSKLSVAAGAGDHHNRFVGLGIYSPGPQWTKIADSAQATNSATARPLDDQAIFVVIDSTTGELRACGDLTGYCIGMNPWKKPLTAAQIAPIILTEHVKPPAP